MARELGPNEQEPGESLYTQTLTTTAVQLMPELVNSKHLRDRVNADKFSRVPVEIYAGTDSLGVNHFRMRGGPFNSRDINSLLFQLEKGNSRKPLEVRDQLDIVIYESELKKIEEAEMPDTLESIASSVYTPDRAIKFFCEDETINGEYSGLYDSQDDQQRLTFKEEIAKVIRANKNLWGRYDLSDASDEIVMKTRFNLMRGADRYKALSLYLSNYDPEEQEEIIRRHMGRYHHAQVLKDDEGQEVGWLTWPKTVIKLDSDESDLKDSEGGPAWIVPNGGNIIKLTHTVKGFKIDAQKSNLIMADIAWSTAYSEEGSKRVAKRVLESVEGKPVEGINRISARNPEVRLSYGVPSENKSLLLGLALFDHWANLRTGEKGRGVNGDPLLEDLFVDRAKILSKRPAGSIEASFVTA